MTFDVVSVTSSASTVAMAPQSPCHVSASAEGMRDEYLASFPSRQFEKQVARWSERLTHQNDNLRWHRRNTFPTDCKERKANAQNFVRKTWVAQKIWKPSWGPAWPPGTYLGTLVSFQQPGPRVFGASWGSKKMAGRGTYVQEILDAERAAEYNPPVDAAEDERQVDYQATRPMFQFVAQLNLERQWLQDELRFNGEKSNLDLDTLAFQSVKQFWMDQGIWRSSWRGAPQVEDEWLHESVDWETYLSERDKLINGEPEEPEDEYMNGYDKYGCRVNSAGEHIDEYERPILRPDFDYLTDPRPGRQRFIYDKPHSPPSSHPSAEQRDGTSTDLSAAGVQTPPQRHRGRPEKTSVTNGTAESTLGSSIASPPPRRSLRSKGSNPSKQGKATSNAVHHVRRASGTRNRAVALAARIMQMEEIQSGRSSKSFRTRQSKRRT